MSELNKQLSDLIQNDFSDKKKNITLNMEEQKLSKLDEYIEIINTNRNNKLSRNTLLEKFIYAGIKELQNIMENKGDE